LGQYSIYGLKIRATQDNGRRLKAASDKKPLDIG